jgi:hypothetical protein
MVGLIGPDGVGKSSLLPPSEGQAWLFGREVDPVARDALRRILIELSRRDQVTISISTHFMNEAGYCDRIALMHAGRVLVTDSPQQLIQQRGVDTLEEAFIDYLQDAAETKAQGSVENVKPSPIGIMDNAGMRTDQRRFFNPRRMASYARRESLELFRDPIRLTLALIGSLILMLLMLIPAMLPALSAVREKELGSITNFYVTPTTRLDFLLGKQLPYLVLSSVNFLLLTLLAVTIFDVPLKGSCLTLLAGALLYVSAVTAPGFADLQAAFIPLALAVLVLLGLSVVLLKQQES